jgi:hypothetical protein
MSVVGYLFKGNCLRIQLDSITQDSAVFSIDTNFVVHPSTDSTATYYAMDMKVISALNAPDAGKTIKTIFRVNIFGSFTMLEVIKNTPGAARPTGDDIIKDPGNAMLRLRQNRT